jgi:lipopolysaccharide transport system ATP-binding protein
MNDIAIRCEGLGKQYRIGERERYKALRDTITDVLAAPFRWLRKPQTANRNPQSDSFWALKDLAFEIKRGEVVGIIGRNGAGKSTLLKILSRITAPTTGEIEISGRVGSLLEVGTGFHPELTGRENIYLNGAILGMHKAEINRKFDEIIAFAEIEKFVDTPVKRYSSGMYVRLAFAVAAHLEPDILVVDEVLAVGDMEFQRKCLNKMQDAGQHGRTVLFVSHNMQSITRLCERAILLSDGEVVEQGASHHIVGLYLNSGLSSTSERRWQDARTSPGNQIVRLKQVRVSTEDGLTTETLDIRKPIAIEMTYEVLQDGHVLVPNYHFINDEGVCVFVIQDLAEEWRYRPRLSGKFTSTAYIPGNLLAEGRISVSVGISTYHPFHVHFLERDAVAFHVVDSLDGDSARGDFAGHLPGIVRPLIPWRTQQHS